MAINWKKILLLLGFLAAIVGIGYLLYFLFFRPSLPPVGTNANTNAQPGVLPGTGLNANIPVAVNGGLLPPGAEVQIPTAPVAVSPTTPIASPIAAGGLTQTTALTNVGAYGATLSGDGKSMLYYDRNSGLFYRIDSAGNLTPLTDRIFYQVEKITWAPNKEQAVLEYPDGANIVYNFATDKQVTVPSHWKDFDFAPNSTQLVLKSMGQTRENRWLAVSNADGSGAKKIELLGEKDATVYPSWSPNDQIIAMYTEDKDLDQQNLFFVGLNQENFKLAIIEGRGFEPQWSPEGDKLLYSTYSSDNGYRPSLSIMSAQGDSIGQNRRSLKLDTWAEKCNFFDNDTVYCAVPQSLEEGAGIYKDQMDSAPTDIYKIDLQTGFKSKVATPDGNHNIQNLTVSSDGRYLYFVDKNDGRLFKINLR
ncbi:MAG: hypothetical protein A3A24_03120 [Candidatus Buchananbacteria bacterium RIFCSPLOWO2_01_FULL_46_12]|uniref:DUF5050 domain-containing protein n=2 Tax=Candidatus Buchananiibacteriota TaxID=1817903 RepID=A0A1G1YP25_9BACT|nr:MAG: hypothetical protein A2744_02680 [Candidatus Buchananbacteria bacterium RIFCSPHIGHO2_01_FULL_44_11]OGY54029.1 MAG: hypothetical protein A3A24_03120 [Candidatus Buchananbacteria bacterium RIFCSPLOWO2_01_FULL_46_12]